MLNERRCIAQYKINDEQERVGQFMRVGVCGRVTVHEQDEQGKSNAERQKQNKSIENFGRFSFCSLVLHERHAALRQRQKRLQDARYPKIAQRSADEHQHLPTTDDFTSQRYFGKVDANDKETQKAQKLKRLKRRNVIYSERKRHINKKVRKDNSISVKNKYYLQEGCISNYPQENTPIHKTKKLVIPDNMAFVFIPPYCPELNPAEKIWAFYKRKFTNLLCTE